MKRPSIILASGSATRRELLERAGIACRILKPSVDEDAIRDAVRARNGTSEEAALALAEAKARAVAVEPEALVIGADQILDAGERWLGKPRDRADARDQLRHLSGRDHRLVTGVVLVRAQTVLWRHVDIATLTAVALDAKAIERYLDAIGDAACTSVGAYQIEGRGLQLFAAVKGDFFGILGLPMVPLVNALRAHSVMLP